MMLAKLPLAELAVGFSAPHEGVEYLAGGQKRRASWFNEEGGGD